MATDRPIQPNRYVVRILFSSLVGYSPLTINSPTTHGIHKYIVEMQGALCSYGSCTRVQHIQQRTEIRECAQTLAICQFCFFLL